MTVLYGDTGRVSYGTLKKLNITNTTPIETIIGTPVSLPTVEPGTPQISITLASNNFPVMTPSPYSAKYAAILTVAGKNNDAAAQTVNYRILKNGTSIATGSQTSIPTTNLWTQNYTNFFDVQAGDTLAVSLWASTANLTYDYYAPQIVFTRVFFSKSGTILKDFSITLTKNSYTTGTEGSAGGCYFMIDDVNQDFKSLGTYTFGAIGPRQSTGTYKVQYGDANLNTQSFVSATSRPRFLSTLYPSSVSYREINP